jgi:hypothetical protein
MLASALHLEEKAICRVARLDNRSVCTAFHGIGIGQQFKPASGELTVTACALRRK